MKRASQPVNVAIRWKTVKDVREVRRNPGIVVVGKQCEEAVGCRLSWVVGDAGFETYCDYSVRRCCERVGGDKHGVRQSVLNDGVGKEIVNPGRNVRRGGLAVDEVAANRANRCDAQPVVRHQLSSNHVATNVAHPVPLTGRYFYTSDWHVVHRARWTERGCSMRSL